MTRMKLAHEERETEALRAHNLKMAASVAEPEAVSE